MLIVGELAGRFEVADRRAGRLRGAHFQLSPNSRRRGGVGVDVRQTDAKVFRTYSRMQRGALDEFSREANESNLGSGWGGRETNRQADDCANTYQAFGPNFREGKSGASYADRHSREF